MSSGDVQQLTVIGNIRYMRVCVVLFVGWMVNRGAPMCKKIINVDGSLLLLALVRYSRYRWCEDETGAKMR